MTGVTYKDMDSGAQNSETTLKIQDFIYIFFHSELEINQVFESAKKM